MALVMNARTEEVSVKVRGNWFTFKSKQIKHFEPNIAQFMTDELSEEGLVSLPEELEDLDFRTSQAGKDIIKTAEVKGIDNFVKKLRRVIFNNQVSLRQDLERANIKVDPAVYATEGEKEAMRLLAKYQRANKDSQQASVDEIKDLMKEVDLSK